MGIGERGFKQDSALQSPRGSGGSRAASPTQGERCLDLSPYRCQSGDSEEPKSGCCTSAVAACVCLLQALCLGGSARCEGLPPGGVRADRCKALLS